MPARRLYVWLIAASVDEGGYCGIDVVPATPADAPVIQAILEDVQRWMACRGIAIWAAPFTEAWIAQRIAGGEFYIARLEGTPIATVRLLWTDPLVWGDREQGDAAYIHTLAVRRDHAGRGIGGRVLGWAEQYARAHGRRFLRLDCIADTMPLQANYRRLAFTPSGTAQVGGSTVTLFEKALDT